MRIDVWRNFGAGYHYTRTNSALTAVSQSADQHCMNTPIFSACARYFRVKGYLWETATFAKARWEFWGSEHARKWPLRMSALATVALLPWQGTIWHFQSPTVRANVFHTVLNQWHWEKSETRNVPWHACQHKSSLGRSPESNWAICT